MSCELNTLKDNFIIQCQSAENTINSLSQYQNKADSKIQFNITELEWGKNFFETKAVETERKINEWKKEKSFSETKVSYSPEESKKILTHHKWKKIGLCIGTKLSISAMAISGTVSLFFFYLVRIAQIFPSTLIGAAILAGIPPPVLLGIVSTGLAVIVVSTIIFVSCEYIASRYMDKYGNSIEGVGERKVRVSEDREFQKFVQEHIVQENHYPTETALIDKELHTLYFIHKQVKEEAQSHIANATKFTQYLDENYKHVTQNHHP